MKEENEELVCGGKRGREDTHDYDKPNQQKKSRANFLISELSTFESTDVEEDFVDDIDEERVYNLTKELMEEIGMVGHPRLNPTAVDLSLQCSAETGYVSCDSASSSINCSSKRVDGCNTAVSTELESAMSVVDTVDSGDYERARILGEYYGEEDFDEVFCEGGVLGKDSCTCNLDGACMGDDDVLRSGKSFNVEVYEIEKSQRFGKRRVSRNHGQSYM